MDNLAHSLVGLAVSNSGFKKLSPGTTAVYVIAANAPDLDVLSGFFGDRWTALHYHRGITHSIVGTLVLALVIPLFFLLGDLLLARIRTTSARIKFGSLLIASLTASATHPLLDWTNNYGVRLLLPWSNRWFYGDLVFIVDPFIWVLFGIAAFLLTSRTRWRLTLWSALAIITSALIVYAGTVRGMLPYPRLITLIWFSVLMITIVS